MLTVLSSRPVKQEIAKEGILPLSIYFSRSTVTPVAWIRNKWRQSDEAEAEQLPRSEETPAMALLLHWTFTILLIACTSSSAPALAYQVLISLYSYTLVLLAGLFVTCGLLYLRYNPRENWAGTCGFKPWGGPSAAIIYAYESSHSTNMKEKS